MVSPAKPNITAYEQRGPYKVGGILNSDVSDLLGEQQKEPRDKQEVAR